MNTSPFIKKTKKQAADKEKMSIKLTSGKKRAVLPFCPHLLSFSLVLKLRAKIYNFSKHKRWNQSPFLHSLPRLSRQSSHSERRVEVAGRGSHAAHPWSFIYSGKRCRRRTALINNDPPRPLRQVLL